MKTINFFCYASPIFDGRSSVGTWLSPFWPDIRWRHVKPNKTAANINEMALPSAPIPLPIPLVF